MGLSRVSVIALLVATLLAAQPAAPQAPRATGTSIAAVLDAAEAGAEAALRAGELQIAESRYRSLLLDAWMLKGELHVAAGRLDAARDAFQRATASAVDAAAAVHSLALVHLQTGQPADAVALLTKLAGRNPRDQRTRRLLAQALIANGEPDEAVQTLEEARAGAPDDPELAFVLASGYVRQKKIAAAEQLFARVIAARPIPETYVLIGRTYRDAGIFDRARALMEKALEKNPRTRRAHYYLGTLAVMAEGVVRLDDAIGEFREELKVSPDDPLTNLRLGMALVERRRPAEALKPLEIATGAPWANSDAFQYLGRCQLALDRPADAVTSLRRALELSKSGPPDDVRLRHIHYQLALALRRVGAGDEAAVHFAEAEQIAARRADVDREQLARYLADAPAASREETSTVLPLQSSFSGLAPPQRAELDRRATTALARASLNLGVMHAQARRFARAAEFFAHAADVAPDFPQVQYSLGVAYFNAEQYEKAVAPLGRALAADSANADVRRMLALASLNAGSYDKAAELLAPDARRDSDPSLQYAYALALVRSSRAAEAEAVFAQLLAHHGTTPELQVLVGQAHAQQGDFESAIASLQGALKVKPDVADAQATLGMIYLQQGKLPEARTALRAGLEVRPGDVHAAHTLATVLDLEGQSEEAAAILRSILRSRPDFANARFELGNALLKRGDVRGAVESLEAAVKLAPGETHIHYQLGRAYIAAGRQADGEGQLEIARQLKEKALRQSNQ